MVKHKYIKVLILPCITIFLNIIYLNALLSQTNKNKDNNFKKNYTSLPFISESRQIDSFNKQKNPSKKTENKKKEFNTDNHSVNNNTINKEAKNLTTKIKQREKIMAQREETLRLREAKTRKAENDIAKRLQILQKREQLLNDREITLNRLEKSLNSSHKRNNEYTANNSYHKLSDKDTEDYIYENKTLTNYTKRTNDKILQKSPDFNKYTFKAPSVVGKKVIIIDPNTNEIMYEKNSRDKIAVASTQKLLTAFIVYESGNLDQNVEILREDMANQSSKIGIKIGDNYSRIELLKLLLVKSSNYIATSLARDNAGSVENFVIKMNQRAKELGMNNSVFKNPHGLTQSGQHSTAYDLAILASKIYKIKTFKDIISKKSLRFRLASIGKIIEINNTNKLLNLNPQCNGMKTGYTNASGYCLISSGQKDNKNRIIVVLKSTNVWIWKDSDVLLQWALSN